MVAESEEDVLVVRVLGGIIGEFLDDLNLFLHFELYLGEKTRVWRSSGAYVRLGMPGGVLDNVDQSTSVATAICMMGKLTMLAWGSMDAGEQSLGV